MNDGGRVSVVIPNWNGESFLATCLDALAVQTYVGFETIVVDNGSSDASVELIRNRWPSVRLLCLGRNLGFPAAVNAGISASNSEFVVALNNDTRAEPDWLSRLVESMDAYPDYSYGSSLLLRWGEPQTVDSAGHTYSLWVGAAHNVGEGEPSNTFSKPTRVFGASAAAAIYRRKLFDDVSLFDEDFFLLHEDLDFDLRANMAGHKCLLIPTARVHHVRGASYDVSPRIHALAVRNRIWTAGVNLTGPILAAWAAAVVARALVHLPARVVPRKRASPGRPGWRQLSSRQVAVAAWDAVRSLPAKRKRTARVRRMSSIEFVRILRATSSSRVRFRAG